MWNLSKKRLDRAFQNQAWSNSSFGLIYFELESRLRHFSYIELFHFQFFGWSRLASPWPAWRGSRTTTSFAPFQTDTDPSCWVSLIRSRCHQSFKSSFYGSFFYLLVTREKLLKRCSYKKNPGKMLMKLTPGVNVTNILWAAFYMRRP